MKLSPLASIKLLFSLVVLAGFNSSAAGDIILVDNQSVSVQQAGGGGFLGGASTFNVSAADFSNIEFQANFDIVDAGVDIQINEESLFPQFDDISQFSTIEVFLNTGVTPGFPGAFGNIESPFNSSSLGPRLTVESTAAGTTFTGQAFLNSGDPVPDVLTPNFAVQDFSSLLVDGDNTIEIFVLNSNGGANLQGDFTVTLIEPTTAVPEPGVTGLGMLAFGVFLSRRRR